MVHSIIELERFWLGQNPAVFFFQSFFFFFFLFVRLPIPRTYYTRNRSISRTFAIRMNSAKSGWENSRRNFAEFFRERIPLSPWPRFRTKDSDICVCVPKMRPRGARGEKKVGLKKSADLFPTIRVVRSANKRMSR